MGEVQGFRSALFIDTQARLLHSKAQHAALRWWAKTTLLLANLPMSWWLLCRGSPCPRKWPTLALVAIFVLRVLCQMQWFWSRSIPWKEVALEAGGIIPLSLASLAYAASTAAWPLGRTDMLAWSIFAFGTWLNVWPEFTRCLWKRLPENKGRLYCGGLFAVCRHINYTGEVLSFVGFALSTGVWWAFWVPLAMGLGMATFSIWEIEFYLAQRYKEDWPRYVKEVPYVMVPCLY